MLRVIGHGRLTRDIEAKTSANGTFIAKFSVACDWYMSEKQTTFLNCVGFGKRAERWMEYIGKGSAVIFEGSLQIREYEGKYYTECIINDLEFGAKVSNPRQTNNGGKQQQNQYYEDDDNSDIPF